MATAPEDVRRPWLPAGLAAHGFTQADVGALTYLVVDEIVGSAVTLVLSAWPWADGLGRLRFLVDQDARGVTVDADALRRALYDGWLDRRPRIGDVFAAAVAHSVHGLQEPDGALLWTRPIRDLVDGPVYDGVHLNRELLPSAEPWTLVLGADAQTTAWAQATVDFPELRAGPDGTPFPADAPDQLRAQVLKVSHHGSKHGINLELVERMAPQLALISSVGGGGKYGFPHALATEALREAAQPSTSRSTPRLPDHELGIHYTAGLEQHDAGDPTPLGSMALLVPPGRGRPLRLWRFCDQAGDAVDLALGREMTRFRGR